MSATSNAQSQDLRPIFFRISIGGVCLVFLIVIIFGRMIFEGPGFMDSISDYYYSPSMRNVFIGGLCILAALLISYRYQDVDTLASFFAGICAIGVAIFPKAPVCLPSHMNCDTEQQIGIGYAHWAFSGLFLATIAFMVLILFTQSDQKDLSRRKSQRNTVYRVCGSLMIVCIIGCFLVQQFFLPGNLWLQSLHPVLVFEASALVLFIISWIVKGQMLWQDENQGRTSLSQYLIYIGNILPGAIASFRAIFSAQDSQGKGDPIQTQSSASEGKPSDPSFLTPALSVDLDEQLKDLAKRMIGVTQALHEAVENRRDDMVRLGKTVPDIIADIEKEFMLPLKIIFPPDALQIAPDDLTHLQEQVQPDQGNPPSGP